MVGLLASACCLLPHPIQEVSGPDRGLLFGFIDAPAGVTNVTVRDYERFTMGTRANVCPSQISGK